MTGPGRLRAALLALVLAGGAPAGCGGPGDSEAGKRDPARPAPTTAVPTPATTPPPARPRTPAQITLAFAGDVHFTGRTAGLLRDPATAVGPMARTLAAADLAVVNLETAVTARGRPEPKEFHFRAPPAAYQALRAAGVDAVSLANNHALDYGRVGLADTLAAARLAGVAVFGAGRNAAEAYRPWIVEVRGTRVAVLGFSQIHTLAAQWAARDDRSGIALAWEVDRAAAAVAAARRQADVVVVFNHWGRERDGCPTADQRRFAARLAAAGADVIVGAHAHVLQGAGWLGRTYVAYGLGNFVWYLTAAGGTPTGVLRLTLRGRAVTHSEFVPAVVSMSGRPRPLSGAAATRARNDFQSLRSCTNLTANPPRA